MKVLTGTAAAEQRPAILDALRDFNLSRAMPGRWEPLCLPLFDDGGETAGGLYGTIAYDWLIIELLVVPEAIRGSGLGSRLIAKAEAEAQAQGCIGAWLDTFSFQARGFYEKLGYSLVGSIPDHPLGGARYFMSKRWGNSA